MKYISQKKNFFNVRDINKVERQFKTQKAIWCITEAMDNFFVKGIEKGKIYTVRMGMKTNVTFLLQLSSTLCNFDDNFQGDQLQKVRTFEFHMCLSNSSAHTRWHVNTTKITMTYLTTTRFIYSANLLHFCLQFCFYYFILEFCFLTNV